MKKSLMIIAMSLYVSQNSPADTCPLVDNLNPKIPPGGWSLFIPPLFPSENPKLQNFYFVSATHSLSSTYYYQQVFCRYEACSTSGCPSFTLISTLTYQQPATNISPWNSYPSLANTVVCSPKSHDPLMCVFTNLPT